MTIHEWNRLAIGDVIVNKRSAGVELKVVAIEHGIVTVRAPHGQFKVKEWTHFQQKFPQLRAPL